MWAAYIADMWNLENDHPEVWKMFCEGQFSVQQSEIPFTARGRDHAGEQVNKVLKTRGGLKGITTNENSRLRHLLIAPLLSSITSEVMEKGDKQSYTALKHHQLGDAYNNRFNGKMSSLLQFPEERNLSIGAIDYQPIRNIVTGQVFPEDICRDVINCETKSKHCMNILLKA